MTYGKNTKKQVSKKHGKKRIGDPFQKKEWYKLTAPSRFSKRDFGITCVSKSQGNKLASDSLKQRVFETNLADLSSPPDEDQCHRKIKFIVEDVQGRSCLTDFHGMDMTRDKLCSLINKWHSLITTSVDVKTKDGFLLRMFCIGFTKRRSEDTRLNSSHITISYAVFCLKKKKKKTKTKNTKKKTKNNTT